jgi:MoxR-like ATPase
MLTPLTDKLKTILDELDGQLVNRESLIQLTVLCAIAREHLLVLGPPGTAKSVAIRAVTDAFGGRYFEYVLGRFTEPNEIFGPVDLRKLQEGVIETNTEGMLPEAHIAFLDEVFLGSSAILNTLLGILNERKFRRGQTMMTCPLRLCVAAANHLPDDESLAAFADRFLVRLFVEPLQDSQLERLLEVGWKASRGATTTTRFSLEELDRLSEASRNVDLSQAMPHIAHCVRALRKHGIQLSDRRIVRAQNLIAASAVLNGSQIANLADLWPLVYVVPTQQGQRTASDALKLLLEEAKNEVLPHAAAEVGAGVAGRAQVTAVAVSEVLAIPKGETPLAESARRHRIEALLREIDAGFDLKAAPASITEGRAQLMATLESLYARGDTAHGGATSSDD